MPFTDTAFVRTRSWVADANNNLVIDATLMDGDTNDIANGLTQLRAMAQSGSTGYGGGATGGGNAQSINLTPPITALTVGQRISWMPSASNTGATTLAINGIVVPVTRGTAALIGNEIRLNEVASGIYDGTRLQLLSAPPWTLRSERNLADVASAAAALANLGGAPIASPVFTGTAQMAILRLEGVPAPIVVFHHTTPPITAGGLWRLLSGTGGGFNLQMNTAAAGDFSTNIQPWTASADGIFHTATRATADNTDAVATTAFVKAQAYLTAITGGQVVAALGYTPANINSPAFTGNPTAPTPAAGDNSPSLATTGFVKSQNYLSANQTVTLTGDVSGSGATSIIANVIGIRGNFIAATAPADTQVLAWSAANNRWQPANPAIGGGPPGGTAGQVQTNAGSNSFGGITMTGDATWNTTTGVIAVHPTSFKVGSPVGTPAAGGLLASSVVINNNTAAAPTPAVTNTLLQLNGLDAAPSEGLVDAHGSSAQLRLRRANGTGAAPSGLVANDVIGLLAWSGYGTTGYLGQPGARIQVRATETWTDALLRGAQIEIGASAAGSGSFSTQMTISGGVVIGNAGTPLGLGSLFINGNPTTANPTSYSGLQLVVQGVDGVANNATVLGYSANPVLLLNRAQGTAAAPLPIINGSIIGRVAAGGWTGSGWHYSSGTLDFRATEDWTASAQGANFIISATMPGSTLLTTVLTADPNMLSFAGATITTGANVSTADCVIELGGNRTGSGNVYIDMHATAASDFEFRILRGPGVDGNAAVLNAGAGTFTIQNLNGVIVQGGQTTGIPALHVNQNLTPLTAPNRPTAAGTVALFQTTDGTGCNPVIVGVGGNPNLNLVRAQGVSTALTPPLNGAQLGAIRAGGWNGSVWVYSKGMLNFNATEDWSATAQGTSGTIQATVPGTTTTQAIAIFDYSGVNVNTGDLLLGRQDQAAAWVVRPNVAGYKNLNLGAAGGLNLDTIGLLALNTNVSAALNVTNYVRALGVGARSGISGSTQANVFNIDWVSVAHLWMDNVNLGAITVSSDYRIKENIAELPSMWDRVKALRPISYTRKQAKELLVEADPAERWGFIAHELQETLVESAATGRKDAPNLVQSPDLLALVATLTRSLQEAMARIETLEAAGAQPAG